MDRGGSLRIGIMFVATFLMVGGWSNAGAAAPGGRAPSGSWPYSNADLANTRDAPNAGISTANVSTLRQVWTFKLTGSGAKRDSSGSLATTPIVENGIVYFQDLHSNVYALVLRTGALKWEYHVNAASDGPNGVAVADGRVYGESPNSAFSLNAATGRRIWVKYLLSHGHGSFDIQPQVANGRLYLATTAGSLPGGGILLALNATTGALLWKFTTVPGWDSWVAAAGGAWETPLVSGDGTVTYGVGNPYQSTASAIVHPSGLLYTDSEVDLDAATGHLRWYYQALPDDFKDYDLQASPISASINGTPVVIGAGKMGYVYAIGAQTGTLVWKTRVGQHNAHDNDSSLAMQHLEHLSAPYSILPGGLGGVLTNMAVAGNSLYVVVCNLLFTVKSLNQIVGVNVASDASSGTGEVEALNLATGKVEWDTKVAHLPLGAATVSNDLVFTTLFPGELIALNRMTGKLVYRHTLPTSTNSPIAVAGNTVLIPAGSPVFGRAVSDPQLVALAPLPPSR